MLYDPKWKENKFGFDELGYPRCPSALLRVGISCLKKRMAEDVGFKPSWSDTDKCLAGSVWYYQDAATSGCYTGNVRALCRFGGGYVSQGFGMLGLTVPENLPEKMLVSSMENTDAFIKDMNNMADVLEAEGF